MDDIDTDKLDLAADFTESTAIPHRMGNDSSDLVADDFDTGEHEKLDKALSLFVPFSNENIGAIAPLVLCEIANQSGQRLCEKYRRDMKECKALIEREPWLQNMIRDGQKSGYKSIRLLSKEFPGPPCHVSDAYVIELLRPGKYEFRILQA
ncbi:hypothetical protein J3R83DRAFT_10211 [Lanmaoa asiatica]|nr:hypothetical protein J3R83DRAFT_10211 [Lanmaoa asiatica]